MLPTGVGREVEMAGGGAGEMEGADGIDGGWKDVVVGESVEGEGEGWGAASWRRAREARNTTMQGRMEGV